MIPTMSFLSILQCLDILWTCCRPSTFLLTIFFTVYLFSLSLAAAANLLAFFLPHIISLKQYFCSFSTHCATVFFFINFCSIFIPPLSCLLHTLTLVNTAHFSSRFHDFFTLLLPKVLFLYSTFGIPSSIVFLIFFCLLTTTVLLV